MSKARKANPMSAWIVSDDHIRLLAQAIALYGEEPPESMDALCAMLITENIRSVNYRYDKNSDEDWPIGYHPVFGGEDPTTFKWLVLKSVDCYSYQSCEHPGWKTSEAKRVTDALEARMLDLLKVERRGVYGRQEYENEPWGFDIPYRKNPHAERLAGARSND